MKRTLWLVLILSSLLGARFFAWAAEAAEAIDEQADRYAVPKGDLAELIQFIERLHGFKPDSVQEDIRHRSKSPSALRLAAERILELENDETSDARQAAEFIILTDRIRSLARAVPEEQLQTLKDVEAYVAKRIERGQSSIGANVAMLTCQTLQQAGRYYLAAKAYTRLAKQVSKNGSTKLTAQARTMEETARGLLELNKKFKSDFPEIQIPPKGRLVFLDLQLFCNRNIDDMSGSGNYAGNGFAELGKGKQVVAGVTFHVTEKVVQLGCANLRNVKAQAEGILVGRRIARLYVLHAAQWGSPNNVADGTEVGQYKIHYENDPTESMPIVYGQDVRDWWNWDSGRPVTRGKVVWTGKNMATEQSNIVVRLYLGVWENPHPENQVTTIDFVSNMKTICAPFCVAITAEEPVGR